MRTRVTILVLACAATLIGCGEVFDELGVSPDDQEEFEEFMEAMADAAAAAEDGGDEGDGPAVDPGWNPDGVPPPPGEPTESSDYSDNPAACPTGFRCGHAAYDNDDGQAAREHYEDVFGRAPDAETRRPSRDENGEPYDAVSSTWDDGDAQVEVYTDHNGTDVHVRSDAAMY